MPSSNSASSARLAPAFTVARFSLLESRRSGLPWIALACAGGTLLLAAFLAHVALTERAEVQSAIAAAVLRAGAVFLIAAHTVASMNREVSDKGVEFVLTLPISRSAWYLGKLLGFSVAGALIALLFGLALLTAAPPASVAAWTLSLAAELAVVAAAALFFASALPTGIGALAAVVALYLLARVMPVVQAIAAGPLAIESTGQVAARWALDAVALALPRLGPVANADWLLYGAPAVPVQVQALAGLGTYFVLLAAAGLFDLSRRNF